MKNYALKRLGFTLIELLVTIAIVMVLTGLLVVTTGQVRMAADRMKAKEACASLVQAVGSYYTDYGHLPANSRTAPERDQIVETTEGVFDVLAGYDFDGQNPRRNVYFSGTHARGDSRGRAFGGVWDDGSSADLFDVWRKEAGLQRGYSILLDYDYDERLSDPFSPGRNLAGAVVVSWSAGKDGEWERGSARAEKNRDNVTSW
ncbi:MAG: type II secretion system protein [Verrucomicrobiota bacterium]